MARARLGRYAGVAEVGAAGVWLGKGATVRGIAIALVACAGLALVPAVASASGGFALAWPESRQEIPNGSAVVLWEDFNLEPHAFVPCQAEAPASLVANGEAVDRATGASSPTWYECGGFVVAGGFTALSVDQLSIVAMAEPQISITEPDGCAYQLGKVEGHEPVAGFAGYTVTGAATWQSGSDCLAELRLEGYVALFGPQAGGFGLLPWRSVEVMEREQHEREAGERQARERLQHEREERENRERGERERRERETQERQEQDSLLTALEKDTVPSGKPAKLRRLLKAGEASVIFNAPIAGELVISWYEAPTQTSLPASAHTPLIAQAKVDVVRPGAIRVKIKLTHAGRRLLKGRRQVTLTEQASFASAGKPPVTTTQTFVLKR